MAKLYLGDEQTAQNIKNSIGENNTEDTTTATGKAKEALSKLALLAQTKTRTPTAIMEVEINTRLNITGKGMLFFNRCNSKTEFTLVIDGVYVTVQGNPPAYYVFSGEGVFLPFNHSLRCTSNMTKGDMGAVVVLYQ